MVAVRKALCTFSFITARILAAIALRTPRFSNRFRVDFVQFFRMATMRLVRFQQSAAHRQHFVFLAVFSLCVCRVDVFVVRILISFFTRGFTFGLTA